jgi:hypothetical protein
MRYKSKPLVSISKTIKNKAFALIEIVKLKKLLCNIIVEWP